MPRYIVLRLTPPVAVASGDFTNDYLTNLTIKVYDISYGAASAGTFLGSAVFVPPAFPPPLGPPPGGTGIVQHRGLLLESVATAVVQYDPPLPPAGPLGPEYVGPDLRIEFDYGAAQPVFDSRFYYNVQLYNSPAFPLQTTFQTILDSEISAFVTLLSPTSQLQIPNDGTPPNFDSLLAAVTTVLSADPALPVTPDLLSKLDVDQCRNIAHEIVFSAPPPFPQVPGVLEDMFTNPPNSGAFGDPQEQNRQQFEGQLAAYYGPGEAAVLSLTNYIYALAGAFYGEIQTQNATKALLTFPVNPNAPAPPLTTVADAQVLLTGALGLDVPAQYFYALTYDLTTNNTKDSRVQTVYGTDQGSNLARLTKAIDSGWIGVAGSMNPAQAVRILETLNIPASTALQPDSNLTVFNVWVLYPPTAIWRSYKPGDDVAGFWQGEATGASAKAFVELVLWALTQGFMIGVNSLASLIEGGLLAAPLSNVTQLAGATPSDWQNFFAGLLSVPGATLATVLPPFLQPGTVAGFISYVQKFFQMGTAAPVLGAIAAILPARFGVPSYDLIAVTIGAYPGFFFGMAINRATLEAAADVAAPGDERTQAWIVQTVETLNELFILSQIPFTTAEFDFSVMEALFARGFTSREEVLDLPLDDFRQALTGTVAYDHAAAVYANAGVPKVFPPPPPGKFGPINPGCLTDCIPPIYLSPLGPVEYLHEMLRVSERSTCDRPFAPPAPGHTTLEAHIDARRGPVGNLLVTEANLETPLPLIDIVNECLEYMASSTLPTRHGTVYDTSEDALAGHKLCHDECGEGDEHHDCGCEPRDCGCHGGREKHHECHQPAALFDALPEYSTPATPVAADAAVEPAVWNKLKHDFSACCLPYDQALDVNRTYLDYFGSCRYEEMRTFRKCITEFVLDPLKQPADFETYLWRYPVRVDIAIEYLGISIEEYTTLFKGIMPRPCAGREADLPPARHEVNALREGVICLPKFLKETCLTYCEFFELWKSGFVEFENTGDRHRAFPECEPCCLDDLCLRFAERDWHDDLEKLLIFIRLWHKLRHVCGARYSFIQLADICHVLGFGSPDFIRQLAAFQMLRDQFRLKLTAEEKPAPGATGANRQFLLSLWVGPSAKHWPWAIRHLLEGIAYHAECRHKRHHRDPEFIKLLESNLDPLSQLAGFDPSTPSDSWRAAPAHTLRFAEIVAKIYGSNFTMGEILYLFTADSHLAGDDPFPLQGSEEASESPLGLPDDEHEHSLWKLRRKLLNVDPREEQAEEWTWGKIEWSLTHEFGFPSAEVLTMGEHFFPQTIEHAGHPVGPGARRFTGGLLATNAAMWNSPPAGPFHYDGVAKDLWAVLPLADEDVIEQLCRVQQLTPAERQAVQDVYFRPRLMLSSFAMLFGDFGEAGRRLIEEREEQERWRYFQREFSRCHARCRVVERHLSEHVEAVTKQERPEGTGEAWLILKELFADENATTAPSWEQNSGVVPPVTWAPPANGGAFAALLGLAGTGLDGEFRAGGSVRWREIRESLRPFGAVDERENCPVLTVIPALGLTLTPQQMKFVTVRNGLAMDDARGEWLGGAEGFEAKWDGVLLIDEEGEYHFRAGAPRGGNEEPGIEEARHRSWKVVLKHGQKTWVLLRHHWHGEQEIEPAAVRLARGAYGLAVEFVEHPPEYLHENEIHRQRAGFEIQYRGPDTREELTTIPHRHLFRTHKDGPMNVAGLTGAAADFLHNRYASSLRDLRRTYQRAFKALLFTHRFRLSARPHGGEESELGYMLSEGARFAGSTCYRSGGGFLTHKAEFNFNLLPVGDPYHSPLQDDRAHPSQQRMQALFDWWERIFDYTTARGEVHAHCERRLWLLFAEARDQQPADPAGLLRHIGADARHWPPDLRFFQGQSAPVYAVTSTDLEDERWTLRAWHADLWLRRLWRHFTVKDMTVARPDLWASDNPAALVFGETITGNANLLDFLCDGCIENGDPRRYDDVRRLNDGLRERGRSALLCYLCGPKGIVKSAKELSDILLLDVLTGRCEKASRIEEAISAVQTFIRRARLGLEPGWKAASAFAHLWDCRFLTFHIWQACKRRELYKENWIDWSELEKAKKIEAFGFLDEQLKRITLTIAEPGGVDYWPDHLPPSHPALCLLQQRDRAEMQILPAAREGLNLLATPERDARPSWITTVPDLAATGPGQPGVPPPAGPPPLSLPKIPFWMECAIRLGVRFERVAAAGYPPASTEFEARHKCHHDHEHGRKHEDKDKDKECCTPCCKECGCEHPAHVDEYYFWLIDAEHYDPDSQPVYTGALDGQQNEFYDQNLQVATPWHDVSQLHALLEWPAEPMVRLAWCRVHNGEFQQPRRSVWGIAYAAGSAIPDLQFKGRVGDSLYLEVTNPAGAGFRYDMVPDTAEEFSTLVIPALPPPPPPPGGLIAYPYFGYFEPGARLFPWFLYAPAIAVANALRMHCRFEAALKWYDLVYDPLDRDNRWAICEREAEQRDPDAAVVREKTCCCDTTDVTCNHARHRSILLHYLDTLLEWGDAVMRLNSPEEFQQARLLFDTMRRIMGPHPRVVKNPVKPHPPQTVATFVPLLPPVNPRLMMLYDRLDDRFALIHECMSARRLVEGPRRRDAAYWGDDPAREGWRAPSPCCEPEGICRPCSPYRYSYRLQKAKELAAQVRELGSELLSAYEKGDGEFLASVRARHESELAQLNRRVREDQWRDADWQVQALEKSKQSLQASRRYYANLIANGLIPHETGYLAQTDASTVDRAMANISEGVAETTALFPDLFVGTVDFAQIPAGTKLAGVLKTIARITNTVADIANTNAAEDLTQAGWDRRLQDWVHQVEVLDIQIEQAELQILGAERRRDQSLRELNIQQRLIEQAAEVLDLLRDKLTNHALYLFLQKYTADLYRGAYDLAVYESRQAERACNYELGHTTRKFIGCDNWDNLHEGFLAGERLQLDLSRMEKAYMDHNCREYELTKHISLRLSFPMEFLRLKVTGRCEIEIPEWMFDLDYPGQYMRRIRNVTMTIPAVAGPFNEVHCRLTLLRSGTRINPLLLEPAARCCNCCRTGNGYPVCAHDPRWITENGALEAIATSSGQNDGGLFEINFHDDRYLPFEYHGAVSRWRIELPEKNNYFDMDSLSDLVLHLNYTSRESGEKVRRAAAEAVECDLPGAGWTLFDLHHDFADAWELFRREGRDDDRRQLNLGFSRSMFPYVPGCRELLIERMAILFDRPEHCGCKCPGECPCCSDAGRRHHELELKCRQGDERRFRCEESDHWPGLYHGVVDDLCIGPLRDRCEHERVQLIFPPAIKRIESAYLLCRYSLKEKCCAPTAAFRRDRG